MFFFNLVIKSNFFILRYVLLPYCWQGCVLQIMNGMGKRQQGEKRHGQSGRNLVLSWLHPTCHAVLFCCANHDNCLSGSIQFKDYSGWESWGGEERRGETRRDETREEEIKGRWVWKRQTEKRGWKKIIREITECWVCRIVAACCRKLTWVIKFILAWQ